VRRRMLAAADILSALVAILIAAGSSTEALLGVATLPVWILIAKVLGLYDRDHRAVRHLTIDELPAIGAWALAGVALLAFILPLTPSWGLTAAAPVVGWWVAAAGSDVLLRGGARWLWRRRTPPELTLIAGEGEPAEAIRRRARLFADMHLQLIRDDPLPVSELLRGRDLASAADGVDRIVVAGGEIDPGVVGRLAAVCRERQVKLSVISPLRGRALPALRLSQVADLPVFEFNTWDPSRSTMAIKRGFDLLISGIGLLLLAPLFPLIAIAIRLDSRGGVIFGQARAGKEGRPFRLYKFRTMRADAEQQLATVVDLDQLEEPMFKLNGDPRVTRVGRVLRRLSLDEVPQLYNVFRGDMSIVGPRPEQVELVQRYRPEHRFRLTVKPGLTGPMQVYGRGELTFAERLAVELDYVENLSLAQDLKILAITVPVVLRGKGAY
jgi:exopolysaccharide biosynthesis polyprenyl glycosylphosphotransferase